MNNDLNHNELNNDLNDEYDNKTLVVILIIIVIVINIIKKNNNKILNSINFAIKNKSNILFDIILFLFLLFVNLILNNHNIVNIILGLLFGFKIGFILAVIIQILSITIYFYFSKIFLNDKITKIVKKYDLDKYIKNNNIYSVFLSRLLPLPVNMITLLWTTKNISYFKLLFGSLIGLLPWTIFELYTGIITRNNKKYIIDKLPKGLYIFLFIVIYIIFRNIYKIYFIKKKDKNTK